ncbi:PASTA domain-containing protein [Desmonostoc muscorum LEGE 12446]|uniref:PASTA domain-containing protein n=1 Tax=Desmonostoc muscorum LEGE 12446 TaxID=1828758 RepID=A0A8J7DDP4_DESMC|nr:PASTA domain-containing protein [Desmonostoc muscorum]MCF2146266.1 PASTA domain-containing protein [Desmonostoc muscorum LEGE 12446]
MNNRGLLLALILSRDIEDPQARTQLLLSGNLLGSSPIGLLLLVILANRAQSQPSVPDVKVPKVTGESVLKSADLLPKALKMQIQELSNDPRDLSIALQSPSADSFVRPGSTVTLFVKTNSQQLTHVTVPDVVELPFEEAREQLQDNNLRPEVIEPQSFNVDKHRKTKVRKQEPGANKSVPLGSTVWLTLVSDIETFPADTSLPR